MGRTVVLGVVGEDMVMNAEDCLMAKPFSCSQMYIEVGWKQFVSSLLLGRVSYKFNDN